MRATVCLNMIVKNESHIIRGTLATLCSKLRFDYWVICDTGSTDDTREIIAQFFNEKNIPGELHCDAWVDFGHNRTLALERAFNKTDLLFIFDADDELHGTITIPDKVECDEYQLKFGQPNSGTNYARTLLINNRKRFKYVAVLHEYISCLEPTPARVCILDGGYYVISGRTGSRNQDPDKYLKDATILASAHAEALAKGDDLHKRYAFYCANSYRDCGRREDAIRWYKTTLSQDNWAQEKYLSCLHIYTCYEALGQKEHGFFYLVKALHYDLERVECLYPLLVHYCCENANDVAYAYYRIVQPHYERAILANESGSGSGSKLFLETDKPNFFVPYYMIIVADHVGDRACGIRMYEIIFRKKQRVLSAWHLKNLFFNLRFFIGHVRSLSNGTTITLAQFAALANEYVQFIVANGIPVRTFDDIIKDFNYDAHGIHLSPPSSRIEPITSPHFSRSECKKSKSILFYAGYSFVPWNHSSMLRGALGGSERAVAHLSQELYHQGYTVYVSGGVLEDEEIVGVKYVGLSDLPELLRTTAFHTIVCSRYVSFLELYGGYASWHQFYIWAHDTRLLAYGCDLGDTMILEKWSDHIDGCVCQTRWHADEYARQYPTLQSKLHVINNGIDATLFPTTLTAKVRNRFIYTSRTERGLSRILNLWPDIMATVPDATLVISTYVAFPCNDDERRIQARIAHLNQVHPGQKEGQEHCIRHLGQLSPSQLYAEMGAAEYWLYPTDWPETSCITAMEMLMSGVICLYYPVAGLTNTMGGCGIQIAPGSELETLCRITSDETQQAKQREQGRAYAEGCTWTHRAQQWVHALHPHEVEMRVAIVNTLTCHYEMFGYILNYVAKKACSRGGSVSVSIFTETKRNDWGWLDFYKAHFRKIGLEFECAEFNKFSEFKTRKQFDAIFVPTDDDMGINGEWIDERFIAIEHTPMQRRAEYQHRIAVRPFAFGRGLHNRWALPCYDIVTPAEKMSCMNQDEAIHAAIVGGHSDHGNMDATFINRILGLNGTRVKLHCVGARWMPHSIPIDLTQLNDRVELVAHGRLCASDMIALLKTCDHVITDVNNEDHIAGKSMSGAIPLAFSTLTPIAMGKTNQSIYKFKTALEFDLAATEPIVLAKISNEVIRAVALERAELVRMAEREFDRCIQNHNSSASLSPIPKRVMQTWEHKLLNPQFQAIMETWNTHNPHYKFVLMDAAEREQFIRAHFERGVMDAYQRIIPGAYKSDLFRYCYLWVNGGVYVDIDTLCMGSLDDFLIPGADLVVPIDLNVSANEGTHNLACGFIAAVPRHPAMMRCIQKIVHNVESGTVPGSKLDFSGPGILGRAVNECLNRGETESLVGNEGLHASTRIHLLKFEPGTEFVKNMKNQVLFQNKNGNHEIANLYHVECCKLKDFVSWVQCASPIAVTNLNSPHEHAKPNVALMIYGQFRSYASNLRENVRMLAPVFTGKVVHVFVLSNQLASGNYSERNEREIRDIFDQAGFKMCFFDYVENLGSHHAANEQAAHDSYFASLKNKDGVSNEVIPDIMYRKFVLNQIKNAHCKQHNIVMDLHVFGRLFDVIIRHPVAPSPLDHTKRIQYEIDKLTVCSSSARTVLGSSDTLFIGTREPMDHLFECGMHLRGPEIWNDHEFTEVMMRADSCLCIHRATYSPEVQYIAHMYFSGFKYRNIRLDYNNPESTKNYESLYDIRLDPVRRNLYQKC